MLEIIPAIMPDSFEDFTMKAARVRDIVPLAQIDIMDGTFVRSKSWPYTGGGVGREAHFLALSEQADGMPFWQELDYEIDLMINEPERHIDEWLPLGASRLIFHIESIKDRELFFAHDLWKEGARDIGGQKVIEVALAFNPGTPLAEIEPYIGRLDFVQCMGIDRIGYQGEPFDERVLEQVNRIRNLYPNIPISIDGGVNFETAPLLKSAGATRLVSGSLIFESEDIRHTVEELRKT